MRISDWSSDVCSSDLASTKLIHGGLRYLEHYEFSLVREALKEREVLWGIAPHIIHPLRFVLPYRDGLRPRWLLRQIGRASCRERACQYVSSSVVAVSL